MIADAASRQLLKAAFPLSGNCSHLAARVMLAARWWQVTSTAREAGLSALRFQLRSSLLEAAGAGEVKSARSFITTAKRGYP